MIKRYFGIYVLELIIVFVLTLSGCARPSQYIVVQNRLVETTKNNNLAEVTATPLYSKMVSQIKSVALNAPSSCANQTASAATGSAESKGSIVTTLCGVEMAEIERALVRQGFTVYSWNMMNNAIAVNKSGTTPIEVAKRLGAQVLFQVNSLERVRATPGRDIQLERSFFKSNATGEILSPLKLDERRINEIKAVVGKNELNKQILGAMLDINAVDTDTGQTIWFYRYNKNEDFSKDVFTKYFLQCWDNWGCRQEEEPGQNNQQATAPGKSSTEVENLSTSARPASVENTIYFDLLREVTADFGKRFSSGK